MKFPVDALDILTPNTVVNQYIKERGAGSFYYAGASNLRSEFEMPSDDRVNPACGGKQVDTGAFTVMFEHVSGQKAELVGKPSALFYQVAVRQLNVPLPGIRCIGDDISTDVAGAKAAGLYAILVKTGKYRDLEPSMSDYKQPDEVLDDLNALMQVTRAWPV